MALSRLRGPVITLVAVVMLCGACNGGLRPTLVQDEAPTPQPQLELELPAAPEGTIAPPPATDEVALEASVDDALVAWATNRNVPYVDACERVVPQPGQLCDVATQRETVCLLGPSEVEIWYVVTVAELESFEDGTGYRVTSVEVAGR